MARLVHQQQLRAAGDQGQQLAIGAPGRGRQAALHSPHLLHLRAADAADVLWPPQQQQFARREGQAEGLQLGAVVQGSHSGGISTRVCCLEPLPQVHKPYRLHG